MKFQRFIFMSAMFLTLASCAGQEPAEHYKPVELKPAKGTVERNIAIESVNLGGAKGVFSIFLPENYADSGKTYPVLYLLHGMYGDNNDWVNNNMQNVTNNYVGMELCPELIVVMPDGNNDFYVDGYTVGIKFESYIYEELIPYIEAHYPCRTDRSSRAIAGLSMGGFGTVYHAFTHPEMFCLAYSMSGAVAGIGTESTPSLKTIFERNYGPNDFDRLPELVLECGSEDMLCYGANVEVHDYLTSIGFPHTYTIRKGVHDWPFWTACYPKVLAKLNAYFKE